VTKILLSFQDDQTQVTYTLEYKNNPRVETKDKRGFFLYAPTLSSLSSSDKREVAYQFADVLVQVVEKNSQVTVDCEWQLDTRKFTNRVDDSYDSFTTKMSILIRKCYLEDFSFYPIA
jgi:hypothetical protein